MSRPRWVVVWALAALGCTTEPRSETTSPAPATSRAAPASSTELPALRAASPDELARGLALLVHRCHDPELVPGLLTRAATLTLADESEPFTTWAPLAQLLAYCDPGSERTLRDWLELATGRRRAAARALAGIASRTRRLEASTVVALLRYPELEETWFALSQLELESDSLRQRVLEQGVHAFEGGPVRAYWVLRALGKTTAGAVPLLTSIASDAGQDAALRRAAVASLEELGAPAPEVDARTGTNDAQQTAIAEDPRTAHLRWLADFERGRARKLRHDATFAAYLRDPDAVVMQRALTVLARVPERPEFDEALQATLAHANPGVVAVAAATLGRVARTRPALAPSRETVQALKQALIGDRHRAAIPTRLALIAAAGDLQVLSLKEALLGLCATPLQSVRAAVSDALIELRADPCSGSAEPHRLPTSTAPLGLDPRRLRFEIAERVFHVQLDPALPSDIAERLLRFIDSGAFDGSRVAVDPRGEWVRLGDPEGDPYPNGRQEPFASHPTGKPFERGSVALWQHGPDAASLELVIVLEDRPDLDADHTRVGSALGDFGVLRDGETLAQARSEP